MTLFRQLMLLIVMLFLTSFIGSLYFTIDNSRDYYLLQLESNAQDTATSLGLSLSNHTKDKATMLSMVTAIFDRGYFSKIIVKSMDGKILVSRIKEPSYETVPKFFVRLINFPQHEKKSILLSKWHQVGTLTVVSNPMIAYVDLWKTTKELFFLFLSLTLLSILLAYFIVKILFRPLLRAVNQASLICKSEFAIEPIIPKTFELKLLTEALNKMVLKLKNIFQDHSKQIDILQENLYRDKLTGIGNRKFFEQRIKHILSEESAFSPGYIIFVTVSDLKKFNLENGFQAGDKLIKEMQSAITDKLEKYHLSLSSRLNGVTFCYLLENTKEEVIEACELILSELKIILSNYSNQLSSNIGISPYHFEDKRSDILKNVDNALTKAINLGQFKYFLSDSLQNQSALSNQEWAKTINACLEKTNFIYYHQGVYSKDKKQFHQEIFIKLKKDNTIYPAGEFIPQANKLSLTKKIDFLVTKTLSNDERLQGAPYSINLSSDLVYSNQEKEEFITLLKGLKNKTCFHFEITERCALMDLSESGPFINQIFKLGFKVGIDRVGERLSSLSYLSLIHINFIKIDGSFTSSISHNQEKQFYLEQLKQAGMALDIDIIATNVESEEAWHALVALGICWGQGLYFEAPTQLSLFT